MPRNVTRKRPTPTATPAVAPASPAVEPAPAPAPAMATSSEPKARNTLRARLPKAKRFVALAGNIGAGKTTAAKLISQTFGFELFDEPVIDNRFLKDYYANMGRWSFTLQLEFLIRRVEHHELIHSVKKSCVQDRTLYEDPEIFAKYLHGLGHMTNAELDLYFEYFQRLTRQIVHPDRVIFFDVPSVDVLLGRIRQRGREEEKGIEKGFLRGLNGYYATFPMVLQTKYGVDCLVLDVSNQDIRSGRGREEFLDRVSTFLS
ncbi:MAG TPA: deoxynucleoside kinase [Archangium sp.]|uniref:deoxynucleoside kinase n=1 Tax=Archangium sp. TaxID=1872627 RepID=UPI002ED98A6E